MGANWRSVRRHRPLPGSPRGSRRRTVYVKFVESFPMTVTGKVQKFVMRETSVKELGLQ